MSDLKQIIIVRKKRGGGHGHHGGAWKVAYADFVTAMMAFFLVMWLVGAGTKQQRAAISEYFKNPSMTPGQSTMAPSGKMGPGGASTSMIKLGGAMDLPKGPGAVFSFGCEGGREAGEAFIGRVELSWPGWLMGLSFGPLLSVPGAVITRTYAPMLVMGTPGGAIIGGVIHGWT